MGSLKLGRSLLRLCILALAATAGMFGCKSKNSDVSSQAFMAPQLIPVDATTGQNAQGQRQVEVLADKLTILTEVFRDDQGNAPLPGTLRDKTCRLVPEGKIDDDRLLIFESESKVHVTVDLATNVVKKVLSKDQFVNLFQGQAPKPVIGFTLPLQNGWILGYETTCKALFAIRADPSSDGVLTSLVISQAEIVSQIGLKTGLTIKRLVEFAPNELLLIPANTNVLALHQLELDDQIVSLKGRIVLPDDDPFLEFSKIQAVTGNLTVDVKDFLPQVIPGTNDVFLYDRGKDTQSFLTIRIKQGADLVYRTSVEVPVSRKDIQDAIIVENKGGEPFTGVFKFSLSWLNPKHSLPETDLERKTLIYAFDEETNNTFAYDYSKFANDPEKLVISTSATYLTSRVDLNYDPDFDAGVYDPQLFLGDNVIDNKLVFDVGPSELLSFNYQTGKVAVVFHRRDITKVTGQGLLEVNYIETLDPPPAGNANQLRIIDTVSSSFLGIRLNYVAIPIKAPNSR